MSFTTSSTGSNSRDRTVMPDPVSGMLHRLVRGPAGQEFNPRLPWTPRDRTSRW